MVQQRNKSVYWQYFAISWFYLQDLIIWSGWHIAAGDAGNGGGRYCPPPPPRYCHGWTKWSYLPGSRHCPPRSPTPPASVTSNQLLEQISCNSGCISCVSSDMLPPVPLTLVSKLKSLTVYGWTKWGYFPGIARQDLQHGLLGSHFCIASNHLLEQVLCHIGCISCAFPFSMCHGGVLSHWML